MHSSGSVDVAMITKDSIVRLVDSKALSINLTAACGSCSKLDIISLLLWFAFYQYLSLASVHQLI